MSDEREPQQTQATGEMVLNPPTVTVQNHTHDADGNPVYPELSEMSPEKFIRVMGAAAHALKKLSDPEE